jgi:hypothetical protein
MTVRGYIVAGGDKPPSFMYPSYRWADRLRAIKSGPDHRPRKAKKPAKARQ